jgi:hypothetical protein
VQQAPQLWRCRVASEDRPHLKRRKVNKKTNMLDCFCAPQYQKPSVAHSPNRSENQLEWVLSSVASQEKNKHDCS